MKRSFATLVPSVLLAFSLALPAAPARAWNGAGHRLVAAIAWREMAPGTRHAAGALLRHHPDYSAWAGQGDGEPAYAAFVKASTWPDDIRNDPRFHDDGQGPAETARHKDWHYVDQAPDGRVRGELDRRIEQLAGELRSHSVHAREKAVALAWLIHLVGDIHQPLHVGSRDDEGGNRFEIEDPFNPRQPFTKLHTWWDDLPGPPSLRGERLERAAQTLLAAHPRPPRQGDVALWREESRKIGRELAYPTAQGSLLPAVTEEFRTRSRAIAEERLALAGYRLARLLDDIFGRVSRETE